MKVKEPINDDEAASLGTIKQNSDFIVDSDLSENGYIEYASGRIEQWGKALTPTSVTSVAFPKTFATACFNVQLSQVLIGDSGGVSVQSIITSNPTTTGFDISADTSKDFVFWTAIGV